MIRMFPWTVGASELVVARPAARARIHAVGRLPARTHSRWFWLALWTSAAAAGFIAQIPALFGRGPPVPANEVLHNLSGLSFAACGLIAWRRRPDSAVGPMLTIAGFGVLLSAILGQVDSSLAFTLVLLFGELWIALYAALILSFVTGGRLTTKIDVLLVEAFVFGLFVMQFAAMLFLPDERNLLLLWPDAAIANALVKVQWGLLAVAALGVAAVTAHRWRVASRPRRRALLPSLGGSLSGVLYAANLTTLILGSPSVALMTALNAALLTVPAALLWGLLQSRLARSGLADLFRELGALRGVRLETGLAKVLGDPALVLAYRVPGEHSYLDGRGQPVELPAPGDDRAAAAVERDGRELGVLIHDTSLDDDPELVGAVAAAAAIALDDARLQTESEDRLAELRASRERIVAAGDAERRRLERNLHDGAQQRLVSVALQLRMIQTRIKTDPELAVRLAKSAGEELSKSLEELRELARGIHPSVLNHGLKAALTSLAARSGVPTTVSFHATERLPESVELAGYFVACEALANVAKYAHATNASVSVSRRNGLAVVEIADDGIGGADETAGTGLQGLADRVAALDGTLRILSPAGVGTVVTAELPCGS
jgi:signal transduction histidine kinase